MCDLCVVLATSLMNGQEQNINGQSSLALHKHPGCYMLPHPFNTFQCVVCCHTHSYRQFYRQHLPRLWNSHPSHRRHASFHTIKYLLTTSGATLIHPYNNTHIHHFPALLYAQMCSTTQYVSPIFNPFTWL